MKGRQCFHREDEDGGEGGGAVIVWSGAGESFSNMFVRLSGIEGATLGKSYFLACLGLVSWRGAQLCVSPSMRD